MVSGCKGIDDVIPALSRYLLKDYDSLYSIKDPQHYMLEVTNVKPVVCRQKIEDAKGFADVIPALSRYLFIRKIFNQNGCPEAAVCIKPTSTRIYQGGRDEGCQPYKVGNLGITYIAFTSYPAKFYASTTRAIPFFSAGTYSIFLCFGQRGRFQWVYYYSRIHKAPVCHNR